VIVCSPAVNATLALLWAVVLCQLAALRLAAQEDADELVADAVEALDTYQDCVLSRPRDDTMFIAPWAAR